MLSYLNFATYWPWWVPLFWLLGYELIAAGSQLLFKLRGKGWRIPTLSRLVWKASKATAMFVYIVLAFVAILLAHFFFGLWAPDWTRRFPDESDKGDSGL